MCSRRSGWRDAAGALVQDVTPGSPAERAGLSPYDLITAVDGQAVDGDDRLIRADRPQRAGPRARLEFLRDGRRQSVTVRLAERPVRPVPPPLALARADRRGRDLGPGELGLTVIEIDAANARRFDVPDGRDAACWCSGSSRSAPPPKPASSAGRSCWT